MKYKPQKFFIGLFLAISLLLSSVSALSCGDVITTDTTLTADLVDCSPDAIIINASDVTLDCAGYKVNASSVAISLSPLADNSLIKNCLIETYDEGIGLINWVGSTKNITGVTIQDTTIIGWNAINFDHDIGTSVGWLNDLTIRNVNITTMIYGTDIRSDGLIIDNFRVICDPSADVDNGECEAGIYLYWDVENVYINDYYTDGMNVGLYIAGTITTYADNVLVENFDINVEGGASSANGAPYAIVQEESNIIFRNGEMTSSEPTWYTITHWGTNEYSDLIDVVYPYGLEETVTGEIKNYWTSDITTNVGGVDIELTSALNETTLAETTGTGEQTVSVVLLAYTTVPAGTTNSTPYAIEGDYYEQTEVDILDFIFTNGFLTFIGQGADDTVYIAASAIVYAGLIIVVIFASMVAAVQTIKKKGGKK